MVLVNIVKTLLKQTQFKITSLLPLNLNKIYEHYNFNLNFRLKEIVRMAANLNNTKNNN